MRTLTSTERQVLTAARTCAADHGLLLIDGNLIDGSGVPWPVAKYVDLVVARLGYSPEQERDERDRFSGGGGDSSQSKDGQKYGRGDDVTVTRTTGSGSYPGLVIGPGSDPGYVEVADLQGKRVEVEESELSPRDVFAGTGLVYAEGTPMSDDVRDEVQTFGDDLAQQYREAQEAFDQFSSNSTSEPSVLALRAALVEVAGAERGAEWVAQVEGNVASREEGEYGLPDVDLSDQMRDAANAIYERYERQDDGSTVTLYRGSGQEIYDGDMLEVNVLSSWTADPGIAGQFGAVVAADIPVGQVVTTGAIGEDEFIVFAPEQELTARMLR